MRKESKYTKTTCNDMQTNNGAFQRHIITCLNRNEKRKKNDKHAY